MDDSNHHPHYVESNLPSKHLFDIDLGDDHYLRWSIYEGERCGGIISHKKTAALLAKQRTEADVPEAVDEFCYAAFTIKNSNFDRVYPGRTIWEFNNDFDKPTLTPSFLCHCGDHGFVRAGKWVRA